METNEIKKNANKALKELVFIDTVCPFCHEHHKVSVLKEEYDKWKSGMLVQRAFPTMAPETRELLITGICSNCWETMETAWDS